MKAVKLVFAAMFGVYCLVCLLLFFFQRNLMFASSSERVNPSELGVNKVEEVTLRMAAGEALYSWYAKAQPGEPTILYFHGNGGSVSTRAALYERFTALGYGVFMLGYPGYGGSEGEPSEQAFVAAAKLSYQYLMDTSLESQDIVLFGESLGSSVAVQLAVSAPARALVLAAPMHSIREIAELQYPYIPIGALLKDPFLTFEHIAKIQIPLLVVHGSADLAIPVSSGRRLYDQANQPKRYVLVEGAGHNNLFEYGLVDTVNAFVMALDNN